MSKKSSTFVPEFLIIGRIMQRYLILAEDGERTLIPEVEKALGCSLGDYKVIVTGVGAVNVIRSLSGLERDAELLNIGHAGSANFEIGSLVEVTEVRLNHPNVTYPEPALPLSTFGPQSSALIRAVCYTNCDFVLASDYTDCVFDMELAFIASLGFRHLHSIKHVSDNLSLHAYREKASGVAPA